MRTIVSTWLRPGEVALCAAAARVGQGGSVLDAIEAGLAAAEEDPELIAIGRGSLPNSDGELELDASVMVGSDLRAGAVCALRGILPAISVARMVMERTEHVMLAGDQARRFAIANGLTPQNLATPEMCRRYDEFRRSPARARAYVHSVEDEPPHDTVTMLGVEDGRFVAASSTSGMPFKLPGRVGDSPIIGAGIYADDEMGAAGATGLGEALWKQCASFSAVGAMGRGLSAQEACDETVSRIARRQAVSLSAPCVVLAIDRQGGFGAATTWGEFDLWVWQDGATSCHKVKGPGS